MMTITEMKKDGSFMRSQVIAWKSETKDEETLKMIEFFLDTYKMFRRILETPKDEFFYGTKQTRMETSYFELKSCHESIYQAIIIERNELTQINSRNEEKLSEINELTEIKSENEEKKQDVSLSMIAVSAPEEGQAKLVLSRGGYRPGAGRKAIGISKPVKLNLPQEEWDYIDELFRNGHIESYADYFRRLHYNAKV